MKKIQVLGTGCPKCNALADAAKKAADALGTPYEFEKISDMMRFADFGVMMTPSLVVDGIVKCAGKLPSPEEIKKLVGDSAS